MAQDFKKNGSGDVIRVDVREFKGKTYLDIRTFYEDKNEELQPTKKGVSIPLDIARDVVQAAINLIP